VRLGRVCECFTCASPLTIRAAGGPIVALSAALVVSSRAVRVVGAAHDALAVVLRLVRALEPVGAALLVLGPRLPVLVNPTALPVLHHQAQIFEGAARVVVVIVRAVVASRAAGGALVTFTAALVPCRVGAGGQEEPRRNIESAPKQHTSITAYYRKR
jgi:hypothetical protein